jgi:hypothetical protein
MLTTLLPFSRRRFGYSYTGRYDLVGFISAFVATFRLTGGANGRLRFFDLEGDRNQRRAVGVRCPGGGEHDRWFVGAVRGCGAIEDLESGDAWFMVSVPFGLWLLFGLGCRTVGVALGIDGFFYRLVLYRSPVKAAYHGLGEVVYRRRLDPIVFGGFYFERATPGSRC